MVRDLCSRIYYLTGYILDAGEEIHVSSTWRSELSNVYIWYASYGSNMWKARFNCYLEGGQVRQHPSHIAFIYIYRD